MPEIKVNNTSLVTTELNNYLRKNDYFEGQETEATDQRIKQEWAAKFIDSITSDLKSKFNDLEINFTSSEFNLVSENSEGACIFLHRATLTDSKTNEFIEIFIRTIVNHPRTHVYLVSEYANTLKWRGESKTLKTIFKKLKLADKKFGYFDPISLAELIKKTSFFKIINTILLL